MTPAEAYARIEDRAREMCGGSTDPAYQRLVQLQLDAAADARASAPHGEWLSAIDQTDAEARIHDAIASLTPKPGTDMRTYQLAVDPQPDGTARTVDGRAYVVLAGSDILLTALVVRDGLNYTKGVLIRPAGTVFQPDAKLPDLRCPRKDCMAALHVAGNVFCESGEYDHARQAHEAEGDATVYACEQGHSFAFEPPYVDDPEETIW